MAKANGTFVNYMIKNKSIQQLDALCKAAKIVSDILRGNPLEEHLQDWDLSYYRDMFRGMNSQELLDLSNEAAERLKYLEGIRPSYAAAIYFGIEVQSNEYDNEVTYSGHVKFTLENGLTWKAEGKYDEYGQSWIEFTLVDTRQPNKKNQDKPVA